MNCTLHPRHGLWLTNQIHYSFCLSGVKYTKIKNLKTVIQKQISRDFPLKKEKEVSDEM